MRHCAAAFVEFEQRWRWAHPHPIVVDLCRCFKILLNDFSIVKSIVEIPVEVPVETQSDHGEDHQVDEPIRQDKSSRLGGGEWTEGEAVTADSADCSGWWSFIKSSFTTTILVACSNEVTQICTMSLQHIKNCYRRKIFFSNYHFKIHWV